jgi:putative DNA primase/helicase
MRRKTLIAFDANVATNPEVGQARQALAETLVRWGGQVFLVELPQAEGVNGPDDFIARCGGQELLEVMDNAEEYRPTITLRPGECPEAVDAAEEILVAHAEPLRVFQRAGEIVRVITLPESRQGGGLSRPAGTVLLAPLGAVALTETLDRLVVWQKFKAKNGGIEPVRVDCPDRIAAAYLSRLGSWRLSVLTGIVSAPILRPDGSVLCRAGYDSATGLFLTEDWPELNGKPSVEDAQKALDVVLEPYSEFPFVAAEDKSVLAAAILSALQRRLLATAPLFGFTAPTQRTGKSLLAECVAITATGRPAPAMAVSGDREEIRKAVLAALLEGHSIVNLDNIEHPLGSPHLSRAITQIEYSDRILGASKLLRLPTSLTWMVTGNNLAFRGDLAVRALLCRQDAKLERPEERKFKIPDLKVYVADHRCELVAAALTILRAYVVAGRPDQTLRPWGGFDDWTAVIRAPLVWLGVADPCATRQHVIEDDPDREQAAALITAWHSVFGGEAVQTAHVIERAASSPELTSALLAVAADKKEGTRIDPRRVSWWCRGWRDRVVDGLSLVRGKDYGKSATWRVMQPPDCGISGISRIKDPSTKTEGEGEGDLSGEGEDFSRGKITPLIPLTPRIESNDHGQASQTGASGEDPRAGASLFSRPMDTNAAVGHPTGGKDDVPTLGWEPL